MKPKIYFNNLSIDNWECHESEAEREVDEFIECLRGLLNEGCERGLVCSHSLVTTRLGSSYTFSKWLDDGRKDEVRRRFLKSQLTKNPFYENEVVAETDGTLVEAHVSGKSSVCFTRCFENKGVAISFSSDKLWQDPFVTASIVAVGGDGATIEEADHSIHHASSGVHVAYHKAYLNSVSSSAIRSGSDLLKFAEENYERLTFCDSAKDQLKSIASGHKNIPHINSLFLILNNFFSSPAAITGDYSGIPFNISNESNQTLAMYGNTRVFVCPDGSSQQFSLHAKLGYLAWRVYFIRINESFLIGYVGKHLPIVSE